MAMYETQKVVIAQLQEQIYDEKMRNTEIETDLREELDRLAKTCSDQQQLIHQAINKAPANTTEVINTLLFVLYFDEFFFDREFSSRS